NVTLYWLTNTAVSSARLYWESKLAFFAPKGVAIPTAVSVFPDEIYAAPRSWTERAYPNLVHFNRLDKGGHFAAWEQPALRVDEVRAGLRALGWAPRWRRRETTPGEADAPGPRSGSQTPAPRRDRVRRRHRAGRLRGSTGRRRRWEAADDVRGGAVAGRGPV